jgi:hypothetical protein
MALTITDSVSDIQSKGGGICKATERLATGAALGTPDTVHVFGKFKDSTFRDKTPFNPRYDESGAKVANEQGDRDTGFNLTIMARDADHINNLRNEVRNKYYLTMKKLSQTGALGGATQIQFAFGQFHPDVEFTLPGGEIPGMFEGIILDTALSLTPGELTAWTGQTTAILPATITIPAGDWTTVFEVTTWV